MRTFKINISVLSIVSIKFNYFAGKPEEYDAYLSEENDVASPSTKDQPARPVGPAQIKSAGFVAIVPENRGEQGGSQGGADALLGVAGLQGQERLRQVLNQREEVVVPPGVLRDLQRAAEGGDGGGSQVPQPVVLQPAPSREEDSAG